MVLLWLGLSLSSVSKHIAWSYRYNGLGLSLLSSDSKDKMWLYYGWVYRCCRLSVSKICEGEFWLGLMLLSSVRKQNTLSYYGWVCRCCHQSVNTICGRIMVGFVVRCRHSVNTIYCRIMIGFVVVVVRQ